MDGQLLFFLALMLCSSFFSCAEMALFSLSDARIRSFVEQKRKNAELLVEIKKYPQKLLIAILIANNVVNVGATAMATLVAQKSFGNAGVAIAIATAGMSFLILFFGEIIPKSLAQKYNATIVLAIAPVLKLTMVVLSPVILVLNWMTTAFQKIFRMQEVKLGVSEEEVKALLTMGHEEGAVESGEREMIERVFLLNDITAEDVMTPEDYMVGFQSDTTIAETLKKIQDAAYSRYPVFHEETADVEGILYIKDVFNFLAEQPTQEALAQPITALIKPATFVPGTMHIDDLLKFFQKKHQHIAMVVDEYGTVLGLVTLEDLLEEIVGEIIDETDVDSDLIQRIDKTSIMLDPRITIGKVNTFFNSNLKGSRHKTVGWLLLREFGHIPQIGQSLVISGYRFTIDDADERKVKRVLMTKVVEPAS